MLGFLSSWKGQRHIPFQPARIPKCPAVCRVVTDCLTASNTFNSILLNIRKAPVILKKKMASADWWGSYSVLGMGKALPVCRRLGGWCSVVIPYSGWTMCPEVGRLLMLCLSPSFLLSFLASGVPFRLGHTHDLYNTFRAF